MSARWRPVRREPVRPFPAELRAEDGVVRLEPFIERRDDIGPARQIFLVRKADRVVLAVSFQRAVANPLPVAMQAREAADIDDPKIERCFAVNRPLCQNPSGAAAGSDAERVEAGADEHVLALGRGAENEIAVGSEALRAIDHLLDANGFQSGNARYRLHHMLLEMIEVVVEQAEFPIVRHVAGGPRLRVRLIAAHDQTADFLLEIDAPVRVANRRCVGGKPVDLFGNDVLVFHWLQRHVDARHRADLPRPLPGAVDDFFAGDIAMRGFHRDNAIAPSSRSR